MPENGRKRRRQPDAEKHVDGNAQKSHALQPDDEETQLAASLFGAPDVGTTSLDNHVSEEPSAKRKAARAAWNDDDDDRVAIDVAGSARLRKLRRDHDEAVISGQEYQQRARDRLASASGAGAGASPDWALAPSQKRAAKRARRQATEGASAGAGAGAGTAEDDEAEEEEEEESDADVTALLRSAGPLTSRSSALAPDVVGISRLRDATACDPPRSVIQSLGWHPAAQSGVLMTASLDSRLRFFRVDGKKNPSLANVHLPGLPISSASWTGDGSEVIATGRRPFFYTYDVAAGAAHRIPRLMGREEKSLESCIVSPAPPSSATSLLAFLGSGGNILLASASTKQWTATLKQDGEVRAAAFSKGPTGGAGGAGPLAYPDLITVGLGGVVSIWDLRTLTCRGRHVDEGSTAGTAVAASPDGSRYAIGSTSGVVNVYDAGSSLDAGASPSGSSLPLFAPIARPTPAYSMLSLTTAVRTLAWHPHGHGDMLLAASQQKKDALRLVHGSSGRVFSNWPTARTPLHYVTEAAFSPGGALLAVGNDTGRVLLYRMHHYSSV